MVIVAPTAPEIVVLSPDSRVSVAAAFVEPTVTRFAPFPVAILTVLPPVPPATVKVDTPFPPAITTALVAEELPKVSVPVCAAAPMVITAAAVAVVKPPVRTVLPVAFPRARAPVPPVLIVVTPAPVVLMFTVPAIVTPPLKIGSAVNVATPVKSDVPSTVRLVPTSRVVVDMIEPGAMKVEGMLRVIVPGHCFGRSNLIRCASDNDVIGCRINRCRSIRQSI